MLSCRSAAMLPRVMVTIETAMTRLVQFRAADADHCEALVVVSDRPLKKNRIKVAKPAALGATLRKAVTGVGAPVYTSGHQKWKGTAAVLNPNPARMSAVATSNVIPFPPLAPPLKRGCRIAGIFVLPVSPNRRVIP